MLFLGTIIRSLSKQAHNQFIIDINNDDLDLIEGGRERNPSYKPLVSGTCAPFKIFEPSRDSPSKIPQRDIVDFDVFRMLNFGSSRHVCSVKPCLHERLSHGELVVV